MEMVYFIEDLVFLQVQFLYFYYLSNQPQYLYLLLFYYKVSHIQVHNKVLRNRRIYFHIQYMCILNNMKDLSFILVLLANMRSSKKLSANLHITLHRNSTSSSHIRHIDTFKIFQVKNY